MQTLNVTSVVLVAVLAISIPFFVRLASSPLAILLLSPFLLILLPLTFLLLIVVLGYVLDSSLPPQTFRSPSAAHPLAFSTPAAWQAVIIRSQWSHRPPQSLPPLYPESPMISAAINEILILIVRDFVLTWYRDISSSPSFPTAVSAMLHGALGRLLSRLSSADPSSILVKRVLPKITAHVEQFQESEIALRGAGLERRLTESEELDMLLASRYAGKGGKLHPAIDNLSSGFTKQAEENHLKSLLDRILPLILPANEARSKALCVVVREITACSVLYPLMDMLTDPDFWNCTIHQLAGAAIRQRRLVSKVRNVLEAQLPRAEPELKTPRGAEAITLRTDQRHFDSFLRSIDHMSSLLDARRLKSDIMGEIRRTRALLADNQKEDWINGVRTEDVVAFLDRLYTAKRKAEQRIATLGGYDESKRPATDTILASHLTLRDILANPGSLSYFMEFMDRRSRSFLVQFWLTVESFKNPLESIESDDSDSDDLSPPPQTSTAKEDISMIYELYFSGTPHSSLSTISPKYISAIRDFANETSPVPILERRARKGVMLAQRQVEQAMEQDFEEFERSELWFRVVEDIGASQAANSDDRQTRVAFSASDENLSSAKTSQVPRSLSHPAHRSDSFTFQSAMSVLHPRSDHSPPSPGSMFKDSPAQKAIPSTTSNLDVLMSPSSASEPDDSRAPLFDDPADMAKATRESEATIEAIQAALSDIIALDNQQRSKPSIFPSSSIASLRQDYLGAQRFSNQSDEVVESPEEDETGGDENSDPMQESESFHLPGPGDLQLSLEISRLAKKISAFQVQDAMLDSLIKKAELTGDVQELRLLQKSKSSLNRELRELSFQKTQFEQQEVANRLIPDRTKVCILNSVVGEENGKSVVRYLVEVQQLSPDGGVGTGWVVARRYNEFLDMHNKLRDRYTAVRNLEFPGKRLVTALSSTFIDQRRAALERYMQNLVMVPAVCESTEIREFLSRNSPFMVSERKEESVSKSTGTFPGTGLVRHVYHSVAGSIDDMFFGPSMLDVMIQRLTRQAAELAGISVTDEDVVSQAFRASGKTSPDDTLFQFSGDLKPLEGETSSSTFSSPICDLILAVFELNKNNWLRRQAIIIIMQQVLGSTVERKVRDTVTQFLSEMQILNSIGTFRDSMWPGGQLRPPPVTRTTEEKAQARDDANRMLSALIPDLIANMIGRSNARRGARRMFTVLQNKRLNQHLAYTILDELIAALFPEAFT